MPWRRRRSRRSNPSTPVVVISQRSIVGVWSGPSLARAIMQGPSRSYTGTQLPGTIHVPVIKRSCTYTDGGTVCDTPSAFPTRPMTMPPCVNLKQLPRTSSAGKPVFGSLFDKVTGLFDKRFILGLLAPAFAFVAGVGALVATNQDWARSVSWWQGLTGTEQLGLGIAAATVITFLAIALGTQVVSLTRLFEGDRIRPLDETLGRLAGSATTDGGKRWRKTPPRAGWNASISTTHPPTMSWRRHSET